jgi:uncharacterized membrane protein
MDTKLLAGIPLFSKLDSAELSKLATLLKEKTFPANQPIFWVGDRGEELFIVQRGTVQISYPDESGKEIVLAALGEGAFFGDISLLDGGPRSASARTLENTVVLSLSRPDMIGYLRSHPDAAIDVLTVLGSRQRETLERLRIVANANAAVDVLERKSTLWQRTADFIAELSANQWFVLFHVFWFGSWVSLNSPFVLGEKGWDPYPYGLLTMIVSLEAIFLSIFVLISQNRSGEKDRVRADADYQVNLKAQYEVMRLHAKIDKLTETIAEMRDRR